MATDPHVGAVAAGDPGALAQATRATRATRTAAATIATDRHVGAVAAGDRVANGVATRAAACADATGAGQRGRSPPDPAAAGVVTTRYAEGVTAVAGVTAGG